MTNEIPQIKSPAPLILIVEDENIVALHISRVLKGFGYRVVGIVNSGELAIQKSRELRPDLILMDIQVQGKIDGIQAGDLIRKELNIPTVFLTAYADEATLQRSKVAQPFGYILKPFEENELHTAIEVALEKFYAFEEQMASTKSTLFLSEERFKVFVDSVEDYAIFMMDTLGNVISWNSGAEKIIKFEASEVLGKHFSMFYISSDVSNGYPEEELERAHELGRWKSERWCLQKDGSQIWTSQVTTLLKDERNNQIGFGKVIRDLTAQKRAQDSISNALVEAKEALRLRDEFLSIASHELKTPLTILLLRIQSLGIGLEVLQKQNVEIAVMEKLKSSFEICKIQGNKISVLLDELLDLTRIRLGRLNLNVEKMSLTKMVYEYVNRVNDNGQLLKKIQVRLPKQEVYGLWDPIRLEQVVGNLISNAVKYGNSNEVVVSVLADSKKVILEVEDHGIGIPIEKQNKIFERFERAIGPSQITGLGLGLYIARQIVEGHGGKISVKSKVGEGSIFRVELPYGVMNDEYQSL